LQERREGGKRRYDRDRIEQPGLGTIEAWAHEREALQAQLAPYSSRTVA
jgi:hypothetical protein